MFDTYTEVPWSTPYLLTIPRYQQRPLTTFAGEYQCVRHPQQASVSSRGASTHLGVLPHHCMLHLSDPGCGLARWVEWQAALVTSVTRLVGLGSVVNVFIKGT